MSSRNQTKHRVFELIRITGGISRQAIADRLNLSLPTVNMNLTHLKEENLITFKGSFQSTGGRKAQAICVNEHAKYAISMIMGIDRIQMVVVGLSGKVIARMTKNAKFEYSDAYGQLLSDLVDTIIREHEIERDKVLGVGISVPAIFDKMGGHILIAPTLHIRDCDTDMFTKHIAFDCCVINATKAAMNVEIANRFKTMDVEERIQDLMENHKQMWIFMMVSRGVGGAVLDGTYNFTGDLNRAGEMGHMTIVPSGRKCECGRDGCLEAYISTARLSDDLHVTLQEFFDRLHTGNRESEIIFDEYLEKMALGMSNIYKIFDSHIVIGGDVAAYIGEYRTELVQRARKYTPFDIGEEWLEISECTHDMLVAGAGLVYINNFIKNIY